MNLIFHHGPDFRLLLAKKLKGSAKKRTSTQHEIIERTKRKDPPMEKHEHFTLILSNGLKVTVSGHMNAIMQAVLHSKVVWDGLRENTWRLTMGLG